ncbi:transposase [Petrotoga halophila]|uniref:transposase n=1 Tax=Petrotoga halophila TaxID=301141 RepID=UPI000CDEBC77|nr:transposase [Petrotoga halophila]
MDYVSRNHSKYLLMVHLIFVCKYRKKTFWSDGYFACSIGNVSKETIEKYIQTQG